MTDRLNVRLSPKGRVTIYADALDAALLAGRTDLGDASEVQAALREALRDAWYGAGAPRVAEVVALPVREGVTR